jgi:hypothetical protein
MIEKFNERLRSNRMLIVLANQVTGLQVDSVGEVLKEMCSETSLVTERILACRFLKGFKIDYENALHFEIVFNLSALLMDDDYEVRCNAGCIVNAMLSECNDYPMATKRFYEAIIPRFKSDTFRIFKEEMLKNLTVTETSESTLFSKEPLNQYVDLYDYSEYLSSVCKEDVGKELQRVVDNSKVNTFVHSLALFRLCLINE